MTSVHGPDTQMGVLEQPGVREQLLFTAQIEEKAEFVSMEAKYIIVQSDNGKIMVLFFFVLFV
jgi:hypothetical protein